ncbi:hypothetical protein Tco_0891325 [Tanacetum coccineum]|uniref:Uncharacterized protein n=1 Tax=Tanacetum coccineum TaxID=301880 RepID=A0ABQ5C5U2_9ASTR
MVVVLGGGVVGGVVVFVGGGGQRWRWCKVKVVVGGDGGGSGGGCWRRGGGGGVFQWWRGGRTLPEIPSDLNVQNTALFPFPDLSVHNRNRFLDEMKFVIDLNLVQRNDECFVRRTLL